MSQTTQEWKKRQRGNKHKNITPLVPQDWQCPKLGCGKTAKTAEEMRQHYRETGH